MRNKYFVPLLIFVIGSILLGSCDYFSPISLDAITTRFAPGNTEAENEAAARADNVQEHPQITFPDAIPIALKERILEAARSQQLQPAGEAAVVFSDSAVLVGNWVYVAATAFPSLTDQITEKQILSLWQGKPIDDVWTRIYIQEADAQILALKYGEADPSRVRIVTPQNALKTAWEEPQALFIFPFEQIGPRWKVLQFKGKSMFSRPFAVEKYPLTIPYGIVSDSPIDIAQVPLLPFTNYDQNEMASVLMTGVTALVRATGAKMECDGMEFPASSIREILLDADLTHISNEVSFAEDCPPANAFQANVMFCSRPAYFDLLTSIDIDVVELSGNHLLDWSIPSFDYSLGLYKKAGMAVYAGGIDQKAAREPYKVEINGNKIAFLGCNPAGPATVWATDTSPGAADCRDDWMIAEVQQLVREGYLPIVTMQHFETYDMQPNPYQQADFLILSAHGAVIVSGSQAHLPQGMDFVGDHFIHYGLGNLFFDQMDIPVVGTRREFLDRHIFYDGKYIQTELITTMLEDYARPRLMTEDERRAFLGDIFGASSWRTGEK
jgi:poly-gamma-glutamate synthesis protein (capsule biosynthesis protein)